jgi:hypothetical protein
MPLPVMPNSVDPVWTGSETLAGAGQTRVMGRRRQSRTAGIGCLSYLPQHGVCGSQAVSRRGRHDPEMTIANSSSSEVDIRASL